GVGGGIVIGGRLFEGGSSAGTEIGHPALGDNGLKGTRGRRGGCERYASARALTAQTRAAMVKNPGSLMWKTYDKNSVCGKTPFDYMDDDPVAKSVVDGYIKHLACGIVNVANVFRPQVVMLGGGVSEQGERLTKPLQEIVDREIFVGTEYAPVKVVKATLGSDAGAFGAASLWIEN
ncbi:MAG: ROK family protein, partial [Clostridia bacterium]|nr:ROK family protein [Clostridia bacterium]